MLNIGSMSMAAKVLGVKKDMMEVRLTKHVCTTIGEMVALSCHVGGHWCLISRGQIKAGTHTCFPPPPSF